MGNKLKKYNNAGGTEVGYIFKCPGCKHTHVVPVVRPYPASGWQFNGNVEAPTFSPSILARSGHYAQGKSAEGCYNCAENAAHPEEAEGFDCMVCHSFVTDGRIQFLDDCTHALAGQTVDLPDASPEASDE